MKLTIRHSFSALVIYLCNFAMGSSQTDLIWVKQLAGTVTDNGRSVTVDASGNVYTTGFFKNTADFDPGMATFNLTSAGGNDIFISKLDPAGNFIWAKQMGGINYEQANSIVVDASGNVYTTGLFQGTADFDPGASTFNLTAAGGNDIFVSKLDPSGNFIWAKQLEGAAGAGEEKSLAVDAIGNVYITGYFYGTADFDPGAPIFNLTSSAASDIFISKLDPSGSFIWAKRLGGTGYDYASSIAVDAAGNVHTAGYFSLTVDFDPGIPTFNLTSAGGADIFINKLDASGNFVWTKQMGGTYEDESYSLALDASGNIYTTGQFEILADFDPSAATFNLNSVGGNDNDIFISKLDPSGNFVWAKQIGSTSNDNGHSIAIDISGNVYTTGQFLGTADFDPGIAIYNLTSAGFKDIFLSKLDASGNFIWAKQVGSISFDDIATSINVDVNQNVYTTGYFVDIIDFDPNATIFNLTSEGGEDVFVSKIGPQVAGILETQSNSILVSPNPSPGDFILTMNDLMYKHAEVEIYNILGEKFYSSTVNHSSTIINMDVSNGTYFLYIKTEQGMVIKKLIVQK